MTVDKGILIHNLYYMLTYAFKELRQNNYEDIEGEDFDNIFDLFAEIIYKATAYQLKRGLHKEYVDHSDALTTVRGKIDVSATIALHMQRKVKMVCNFDEFSEDNLHNRIIKSTLVLLVRSKEVKKERRQKLRSILLFFSNVSECNLMEIRWNDIKYDRNSSTYRLLHTFCYFIVRGLLLTTEQGPYTLRHFDEEMISRLFEKFVLNYYLRHYPMYSINASEVEWNIVPEESTKDFLPKMRTDITIKFPNRTFIIDTKYYEHPMQKYMGKYSINNDHLYQLMAYITNEDRCHLGNVDGMLLYAKTQDEVYPDGKMRFADGNTLYFQTLDLNQEFGNIRRQLDEFIRPYL